MKQIHCLFMACLLSGSMAVMAQRPSVADPDDHYTPSLSDYFAPVSKEVMTPDEEGFLRRWSLLDPIDKPNRSNTVFVDSYLHQTFDTLYFANQFTIVPRDGEKVKIGGKKLQWHAFDSKLFNIKLMRFATGMNMQRYGVLFWVVTVINCEEEMTDVRLSVGSNAASKWWLNGEEALILSGDRRMVMDDATSKRLTLNKGKNVLRGAVINGPGMSDFCVRLLDSHGNPVRNITLTNQ